MDWEERQLAPINLRYSKPEFPKKIPQNFSIPETFVYYISKNVVSPKIYRKLIKTCKYFPENNQIVFLHCLSYNLEDGGFSTCNFLKKNYCGEKYIIGDTAVYRINIDIIPHIIWVEHSLSIDCKNSDNLLTSLIPRIKCTATSIFLYNTVITLTEFRHICRYAKICHLRSIKINDESGEKVSQPNILNEMPKISKYTSTCVSDFTAVDLKEILELPKFVTLKEFSVWHLTENFDMEEGFEYLKKNKCMKVRLTFDDDVISEAVRKKVDDVTDKILTEKKRQYFPPYLFCPSRYWSSDSPNGRLKDLHENYKVLKIQTHII